MKNKLTLTINNKIVEQARLYARKNNSSLSKLVESYLQFIITSHKPDSEEITPLVKSLSGILNPTLATGYKAKYERNLRQKYLGQ